MQHSCKTEKRNHRLSKQIERQSKQHFRNQMFALLTWRRRFIPLSSLCSKYKAKLDLVKCLEMTMVVFDTL